jgi:pimeloyl-ACP methyl ester carboxylesterase
MLGGWPGMLRYASFVGTETNFDTFLPSRRGFGASTGSNGVSGELGVFLDLQAILSYLVNVKGIDMKNIYIYGYCLGSVSAMMGAYYYPSLGGIVTDRGIDKMVSNPIRIKSRSSNT